MTQKFPHKYEHKDMLKVTDRSSPVFGQAGVVLIIFQYPPNIDPSRSAWYTIVFDKRTGKSHHFLEHQLEKA